MVIALFLLLNLRKLRESTVLIEQIHLLSDVPPHSECVCVVVFIHLVQVHIDEIRVHVPQLAGGLDQAPRRALLLITDATAQSVLSFDLSVIEIEVLRGGVPRNLLQVAIELGRVHSSCGDAATVDIWLLLLQVREGAMLLEGGVKA
jgi:hypothetical protein